MNYISTRDKNIKVSAAQAIAQGISRDMGLFVPETLPHYDTQRLQTLVHKSYTERACDVLKNFLTDFTEEEIHSCVKAAYNEESFDDPRIAPMSCLSPNTYMLELWHGPTCAFKDMALQLLPHLLTRSVNKVAPGTDIALLVATSGDTGKAALEGFADVPGTQILVFFPKDGVSRVQWLQMATQTGKNVGVCGVEGNFDDTQTAVKQIFTNPDILKRMQEKGKMFSSANSINWGRLVPQIVYYISAYCDLVLDEEIAMGDPINVTVPTGNFGNILAAYYAKKMGLPIAKLLCASNLNNVLTDFFHTGVYDRRRAFHLTSSPSMDILISSNLERLLFALYDEDDQAVSALMQDLSQKGIYQVSQTVQQRMAEHFYAGFCDEKQTAHTIRDTFEKYSYLLDTHTAVAKAVHDQYVKETGDQTKTLIVSTANPYKFTGSILEALTGEKSDLDELKQAEELYQITGMDIPEQIVGLANQTVRFQTAYPKDKMQEYVFTALEI